MYPVSACKKFSKHHLSIECSCPDFENGQHAWLKCNVFLWQTGLRINTNILIWCWFLVLLSFRANWAAVASSDLTCSVAGNTAEEVTQKIADWATNQLDWFKFQAENLIHSLSSPKLKSAPSVWLFSNALTQAFEKFDPTLSGSSKKQLDSLLQKLLLKDPVQTPNGFSWTKPNSN